jgi:hypothetical protein
MKNFLYVICFISLFISSIVFITSCQKDKIDKTSLEKLKAEFNLQEIKGQDVKSVISFDNIDSARAFLMFFKGFQINAHRTAYTIINGKFTPSKLKDGGQETGLDVNGPVVTCTAYDVTSGITGGSVNFQVQVNTQTSPYTATSTLTGTTMGMSWAGTTTAGNNGDGTMSFNSTGNLSVGITIGGVLFGSSTTNSISGTINMNNNTCTMTNNTNGTTSYPPKK